MRQVHLQITRVQFSLVTARPYPRRRIKNGAFGLYVGYIM